MDPVEELGELEGRGLKAAWPDAVSGRSTRDELAYRLGEWLRSTPAEERACGMCSCSEGRGCAMNFRPEGSAVKGVCAWVAPGLCSACALRLGALAWLGLRIGDLKL